MMMMLTAVIAITLGLISAYPMPMSMQQDIMGAGEGGGGASIFGPIQPQQSSQMAGFAHYPGMEPISPINGGGGMSPFRPYQMGMGMGMGEEQMMRQQMMMQQRSPYGVSPIRPIGFGMQNYPMSGGGGGGITNEAPSNIPLQVVIGRQQITPVSQFGSEGAFQNEEQQSISNLQPSPPASQSTQSSLPKFLQGAPQQLIDEYKKIIRTPNSNYGDQVKRIEQQIVGRLDAERQDLYKQFMRENDEREQQHRDRVHSHVGQMSNKAQEQFAKISATLRNPGTPDQERWERVLAIYGRMEPDLRNEFEQKFKGFASA